MITAAATSDEERICASCRTGSDGAFELAGLPGGEYLVAARSEGLRFETTGDDVARPGEQLEFTASPEEAVRVRVLLPDGTEPAEAEVSWAPFAGAGSVGTAGWHPESPVVGLPPGPWTLLASAGEDGEYASDPVAFVPPAPGVPREISLPLIARPGLLCRLRAESGAWSGMVDLRSAQVGEGASREPKELLREADPIRRMEPARNAAFFLSDLGPGEWCLGACAPNGFVLGHAFAVVGEDLKTVEIEVAEPDRSCYVLVRAVGPRGGRPSEFGGRVRLAGSEGGGCTCSSCLRRSLDELPDGSFRLWFPNVEGGGSQWVLEARAEGCALQRTPFTRTEAPELHLRFVEPAWLDVALEGSTEAGEGVRVRLVPFEGPEISTWMDEGETERLGPGLPGSYGIRVMTRTGEVSCTPTEVTLAEGLNSVSLRLGLLCEVTVAFGEEQAGASVTVASEEGGTIFRCQVGDPGDVTIPRLVPGSYRLTMDDRQRGSMSFTVPGPSRILFAPEPVDCLRVVIENANGLLSDWGLRDADLIVSVDGAEIPNEGTARALLELAATRGRCTFAVLRGGDRFDLEVTAPRFDSGALGGNLEAAAR
jgi:hypothetical protein